MRRQLNRARELLREADAAGTEIDLDRLRAEDWRVAACLRRAQLDERLYLRPTGHGKAIVTHAPLEVYRVGRNRARRAIGAFKLAVTQLYDSRAIAVHRGDHETADMAERCALRSAAMMSRVKPPSDPPVVLRDEYQDQRAATAGSLSLLEERRARAAE